VPESDIERIWALLEEEPGREMTVDLQSQTVTVGALSIGFDIDAYTRWRLLEGLDDIALTLRNEQAISEFESRRERWRPRTLPVRQSAGAE